MCSRILFKLSWIGWSHKKKKLLIFSSFIFWSRQVLTDYTCACRFSWGVPSMPVRQWSTLVEHLVCQSHTKPFFRSKGRKFEKARGRRNSRRFKVWLLHVMEHIISSLPYGLDVNFGYGSPWSVLSSCLVALFPEYILLLCGSVHFSALPINWGVYVYGPNYWNKCSF